MTTAKQKLTELEPVLVELRDILASLAQCDSSRDFIMQAEDLVDAKYVKALETLVGKIS